MSFRNIFMGSIDRVDGVSTRLKHSTVSANRECKKKSMESIDRVDGAQSKKSMDFIDGVDEVSTRLKHSIVSVNRKYKKKSLKSINGVDGAQSKPAMDFIDVVDEVSTRLKHSIVSMNSDFPLPSTPRRHIRLMPFLLTLMISIIPALLPAQTDTTYITGGTITQDSTWTLAQSPYVISGDVVVDNGATLTIEPGVEILFDPTDEQATGMNTQRSELRFIYGTLISIGTEFDSITFRGNGSDPNVDYWAGIFLGPYGVGNIDATIKYCIIRDTRNGGGDHANGVWLFDVDTVVVTNNLFVNNSTSLKFEDYHSPNETKDISIRNNKIINGNLGISYSDDFGGVIIEENIFDNLQTIVNCGGSVTDNELILLNNNFLNSQQHFNASTFNVNSQNNYWGPTATAEMNAGGNPKNISTIHDYFDDPNLGMVNYSHWLDAPWPDGQPVGNSYSAEFLISNNQFQDEMLTYHSGDSIFFQVTDLDRNTDDIIPESITIDVSSALETTPETVTLTETDLASAVFRGYIPLDDATGVPFTDGQLQVNHGDWMYFQYTDPADDWGNVDTLNSKLIFDGTIISGYNGTGPYTFSNNDSPIILTGDVYVGGTGQLVIESGTKIYIADEIGETLEGYSPNRVAIRADGPVPIIALGTASDSIIIQSYRGNGKSEWEGLCLGYKYAPVHSKFSYLRIMNASRAITGPYGGASESVKDTVTISHALFNNCNESVSFGCMTKMLVDSCTFVDCNSGFSMSHFHDALSYGDTWGVQPTPDANFTVVRNNTFTRVGKNYGEAAIVINSGKITLTENDFFDCPGIVTFRSGSVPPSGSKIFNNNFYNAGQRLYLYTDSDINARSNYWGSTLTQLITSGNNPQNLPLITDYFDYPNLGMVNYSHWLDAPWPDGTPAPGGYSGELKLTYSDGTDAWGYHQGDTMFVQVYDPDLNLDINVPETAQVEVWSELETIPETLTLTEIDADTGLFKGWMLFDDQTGFSMTDGILQVDQGNRVWAQYTDAVDDWNNQNVILQDSVLYNFRIREYEPDSNTVLLLHFNEGEGQIILDNSPNNNTGYLGFTNSIENQDPDWINGISGHGLKFTSAYQQIVTSTTNGIDFANDFTIEMWVLFQSWGQTPNNYHDFFSIIDGGNNLNAIRLERSDHTSPGHPDGINFLTNDNNGNEHWLNSLSEISIGQWVHIAVTRDGTIKKLYLNGQLEAESNTNIFPNTTGSQIEIGGSTVYGGIYMDGIIDEVRISNIARTSFDYEYTANPPGKVNDLTVTDSTSKSIILQWHAPGADNYTGTATTYDLRMSTSPIDSANFAQATSISGLPSPASAGTIQTLTIDSLNYSTTYYFAIKTQDDEGLWSPISNIAVGHTEPQDVTPPGTITDLTISEAGKRYAVIAWTAPADDGQTGRPVLGYSIHYSLNPITETNFFSTDSIVPSFQSTNPGEAVSDTITNLDPNTTYYFAVKSYDEVPNWSAISNVAQGSTGSVPIVANTTFPQNGYDAQRSRFVPRMGATQGTFRWSYATGGAVSSSPAIDNAGNVYFGSEDGNVYALDGSGNLLWSKSLGAGVFSAPCIGTENHLFVAAKNNKVYALNSLTGDTIWTFTTGNQVYGSPVVSSFGYLYVGSLDNTVYALTSDGGELLWSFTGNNRFYASPALNTDESMLVIGNQSGVVYALDSRAGTELWNYNVGSAIYGNAAIDSTGNVYVGAQNGNLYALDVGGNFLWNYNTGGAIFYASPTIEYASATQRQVPPSDPKPLGFPGISSRTKDVSNSSDHKPQRFGGEYRKTLPKVSTYTKAAANRPNLNLSKVSNLRKVNAGDLRKVKTGSRTVSQASLIYIGSDGGNLHAVDALTGTGLWTYNAGSQIRNGALLSANGYLYFGAANDSIYCIDNTGNRRWAYSAGGAVYTSNAAMGLDGSIYIGSYDNSLYAVGEYLEVVDPVVVATYPAVNSVTAPVDTTIEIKFNTVLNMFTVNDTTVYVSGNYRGRYSSTYDWRAADSTLLINSDSSFFYGEEIIILLRNLQSVSGGLILNESYQWSFTSMVKNQPVDWSGNTDWETYTDGLSFSDIKYADIDLDGDIDLIGVVTVSSSTYGNSGDILIFENRGTNINPIPLQTIQTDNYGESIVLCDINNDAQIDITMNASQGIEMYINQGGFFFSSPSISLNINVDGYTPYVFTDINNDSYKDLLVNWSGICYLYLNTNGTFSDIPDWTSIYISPDTWGANYIVPSDFNNDGQIDLLVNYCIFYNNNLFSNDPDIILNNRFQPVFSQDINNDGYKDIIYSGGMVYLNDGGSFNVDQSYSFNNESSSSESISFCRDLNGDGYVDLGSGKEIFLNNHGVFDDVSIVLGNQNRSSSVNDIDNNGLLDRNWWDWNSPEIHFEYGGPPPVDLPPRILEYDPYINQYAVDPDSPIYLTYSKPLDFSSIGENSLALISDINGSLQFTYNLINQDCTLVISPITSFPYEDRITINVFPTIQDNLGNPMDYTVSFNYFTRSENNYMGLLNEADWTSMELYNFAFVDVGFVDQDEFPELLLSSDQNVKIIKNIDGQYAYEMWSISPSILGIHAYYFDVDNDNYDDILVVENQNLSLYKNYSGNISTTPTWTFQNTDNISDLSFSDLDNDTFIDIAIASGSGHASSGIIKNNGGNLSNSYYWEHTVLNPTPGASLVCAWGDYDNDGFNDIIFGDQVYHNSNGNIENNYSFKLTDYTNSGRIGYVSFVDINNDSFPEISNGFNYWENIDGVISTQPYRVDQIPGFSRGYWADINGDEYQDLILVRLDSRYPNNATNLIFYNNYGVIPDYPSWSSGEKYNTNSSVIKDIDSDGDLDIVFGTSWEGSDPITIYYNHSEWLFNVSINEMNQTEYSGLVSIPYTIENPGGNPTSLTCRYSADNGQTWHLPATVSDTSALTTGQYSGMLEWNSPADGFDHLEADILFAITPYDGVNTGRSDTVAFHLDNNAIPTVTVQPLSGEQSGDIALSFSYSDAENDTLSLSAKYRRLGDSPWTTATLTGSTDGLTDSTGTVIWSTLTDLPDQSGQYFLRLTVADNDPGQPDTVGIQVDNYHSQGVTFTVGEQPARDTLALAYTITDPTSDTLNLIVRYRLGGAAASRWNEINPGRFANSPRSLHEVFSPPSPEPRRAGPAERNGLEGRSWYSGTPSLQRQNSAASGRLNTLTRKRRDNLSSRSTAGWLRPYIAGDTLSIPPERYTDTLYWYSHLNLPGLDLDSVYLALNADDSWGTGIGDTLVIALDNNRSPEAELTPITTEQRNDIVIDILLTDAENDPAGLTCEYKQEFAAFWSAATITGDTTGLVPGAHQVVWNSAVDLPEYVGNAFFRVRPRDADWGRYTSILIPIDQVGAPAVTLTLDTTPELSGDILAGFTINDGEGDTVTLNVSYSLDDGASWSTATTSLTGALDSSSYKGQFIWHSAADAPGVDVAAARLKVTPFDGHYGAEQLTAAFHLDNNAPPAVTLTEMTEIWGSDVRIEYALNDPEGDTLALTCGYLNQNQTWQAATIQEDLSGLTSAEYSGSFTWLSETDLPGIADTIYFTMLPADADPGAADTIAVFLDNLPPSVSLTDLSGEQSGDVTIHYQISNDGLSSVGLFCEYSLDGGTAWNPVSFLTGDLINIQSTNYSDSLVWHTGEEVPGQDVGNVRFRITPFDSVSTAGQGRSVPNRTSFRNRINQRALSIRYGTADTTAAFHLDNNAPPEVALTEMTEIWGSDVRIEYVLNDPEGDTLALTCGYLDQNQTWQAATIQEDLSGLTSAEYSGSFTWLSETDLPGIADTIYFTMLPADADPGAADTIAVFLDNLPPSVSLTDLSGEQSGDVTIHYQISNDGLSSVGLFCEYSLDGGTAWNPVSFLTGDLINIQSANYSDSLVWHTGEELPGIDLWNVQFRVTPFDSVSTAGQGRSIPNRTSFRNRINQRALSIRYGTADTTAAFHLDNNAPPVVTLTETGTWFRSAVSIPYVVSDPELDDIGFTIDYYYGGSWDTASSVAPPSPLTDTQYTGEFLWFSAQDLPAFSGTLPLAVSVEDADPGIGDTISVYLDRLAPVPGIVRDGGTVDQAWSNDSTTLRATWTGFQDSFSGINSYAYSIGASPGDSTVYPWQSTGPDTFMSTGGLHLISGTTYFVNVRCTDRAGNRTEVSSDGITIDLFEPTVGVPLDGSPTEDLDWQARSDSLFIYWTGNENRELATFEFCLGTAPGDSDQTGWTATGSETFAAVGGLNLMEGVTYYASVRAYDLAGNQSLVATSDGIGIDLTPPGSGLVFDGVDGDLDFSASGTTVDISWSGFTDGQSGIDHYLVGLGTTPDTVDVAPWIDTVTSGNYQFNNLSLKHGTTYFAFVIAEDRVNRQSPFAVSDGFTVDLYPGPPQVTQITPNQSPDNPGNWFVLNREDSIVVDFSEPLSGASFTTLSTVPENALVTGSDFTETRDRLVIRLGANIPGLDTITVRFIMLTDSAGLTTTKKNYVFYSRMVADYDNDRDVDVEDIATFITAWENQDLTRELGPVEGTVPHLLPTPDGTWDLRDIMTFTRMWNWNHTAAPARIAALERHGARPEVNQHGQELVIRLPEGSRSGTLWLDYPVDRADMDIRGQINTQSIILKKNWTEEGSLLIEFAFLDPTAQEPLRVTAHTRSREAAAFTLGYRLLTAGKTVAGQGTLAREVTPVPEEFALHQNYPNPFNPVTTIEYDLPENGMVDISIVDLTGREIARLVHEVQEAGYRQTRWKGENRSGVPVSAGVYFCVLRCGSQTAIQKMVLLK